MPHFIRSIDSLKLKRFPTNHDKSLRAWSAADEFLIEHLQNEVLTQPQNCLIINDQFGALTCSLEAVEPHYWSDSWLSQEAIRRNLKSNFSEASKVNSFEFQFKYSQGDQICCSAPDKKPFDLILLRVPKHNSLLEFQLNQLKQWIVPESKIIAAGMTKEIHKNNLKLFESIIGSTHTSLAKKKARLIFSKPENTAPVSSKFKRYHMKEYPLDICALAGVFSRDKLDIGTQVLLRHLPEVNPDDKVIDLGCGSGVIGAIIAKKQPDCQVLLSDESHLAVGSAELTFAENQLNNGEFIHTDVLHQVPRNEADHILCNPPFHQQNVQTLAIAKNMFRQSAQCLKAGGELRVVANRHLKYQVELKRYFAEVSVISKDSKFSVWLARLPRR